ncbi:MAG: DUF1175 family protein [Acidobacteriaceae bacterium]|nr:DUF1175 family protein [Acidobacteriaceae bacterium]MBV9500029.1 DUF1175 family protein [Acidobacteriaceae bacterium]
MPLIPAIDSIAKYNYPRTPLGPALFRVRSGPWSLSDLQTGALMQFANAETLQRFNTFLISRDLGSALPGDLLIYRRSTDHVQFYSVIFLGRSQITPGALRCSVKRWQALFC